MSHPQHLEAIDTSGRTYGRCYKQGAFWYLEAEPYVMQVAKRTIPGCEGRCESGKLRFQSTARTFESLNWLMIRFPMEIVSKKPYERDLEESRALAERRSVGAALPPLETSTIFRGILRPYQEEGAKFLIHNKRCLLADGMGLGKTVMAMGALAHVNQFPVAVVCPSSVMGQWADHADRFLDVRGFNLLNCCATILKGHKTYEPDPAPVYILHYGLLQYWREKLQELGVRVVIFDEVQDLRHMGTQKYSESTILSQHCEFAWGLSGTPVHNYGGEIYSIMNALEYLCLDDFGSFSREWCAGYGEKIVNDPIALGNHLRNEGLMLRRVLEEVSLELPPKRRAVIPIDHDRNKYAAAVSKVIDLAGRYSQIREFTAKGQAKREIIAESRKATGVSKAPYVADFVDTLLEAGEKVLLFAWHHEVHDTLITRLRAKWRVTQLSGKQNTAEKEEALRRFQSGNADVIVLSLRTAAGLNGLQDHGTCVVFAELDWSPAIHAQCEDRLHRDGVKAESVLCYYLVAGTGYDETMQYALGLKTEQIKGLLGEAEENTEERKVSEQDIAKHLDAVIARVAKERKGSAA